MESRSWGAVVKAATKEQIKKREMDVLEAMAAERNPARVHIGNDDEIYYMDANGEFWDEISSKELDSNGVKAARL